MKFRTLMSIVAAAALVAAFTVTASAAQLKLSVVYEASYGPGPTYDLQAYSLEDGVALLPGTVLPGHIHQFGLLAELTDVQANESLSGLLADVILGPGLMPSIDFGSYAGDTSVMYDPPPIGPAGGANRPLFSTNTDAGDQDLIRLAVETDNLAALALNPGEAGPYQLGSFFVQWDGVTPTSLFAQPAASAPADPWALWVDNVSTVPDASGFQRSMNPDGPTMDFDLGGGTTDIPEPASITLFCLAVMGLIGIRRRRS